MLTGGNLVLGQVSQQCSNTVPAGSVISQTPQAGSSVAYGSVVALVVSSGPCPVTVPNVVGQTQTAAGSTLGGVGLVTGQVSQQCSNTVPAGLIISQSPAAGNSAPFGSAIALVISSGPCPVTVPNVVGQTQTGAGTALTGVGLVMGQVSQQCSDTLPAGQVISQDPRAGNLALFGSAVSLVISTGPCPVTVPNVVGQTQSVASTAIVGANLVVGTITQEYNSQMPTGTVISQTPSAGESVAPGTAVLLTVSKGPQPVITGSILINKGAYAVNSANASLSLTWSSNAVRMRFSDNGSTWTAWESLKATRAYTLPVGDGYKTVRVQFIDIANNRSVTYSDYILLDTTLPTGSIVINGGAKTTASVAVTLNLTYADTASGTRSMRFSNDGATWSAWESAAAGKAWTLAGPAGYNTVRVQYRDGAGNYSAVYNDYIFYQPV
jgi:beta-lactam-binding protein with PASTA domain